jgi:hypothetical protein
MFRRGLADVFVTAHAAERYAQRVEPVSRDEAIVAIAADIAARTRVKRDGDTIVVTGARPRRVRYRVAPPLPGMTLPAVITVLSR